MSNDLAQWLQALDLGKYVDLFAENDIDLSVLPHITDAELAELGLPLGARRRIQLQLRAGAEEAEASAATPVEAAPPADAERRQVTVMFCDLVGSTALSSRLDPETYRDTLRAYQDACAGEIARHDGHVAQFLGDGVLAYFGWPRAREDDVAHAIRAALDIIAAVGALIPPAGETQALTVRIGIATGPVVIGDMIGSGSAQQAAVTGETPNRAARVQGVAGPNEIAVDEATRALGGGRFDCETLGMHTLKGLAEACEVWRVIGARRIESRFAAARGENLTPLIGRDEELGLLVRRWQRACREARGAAVLLTGEPGIGKSRLARALEEAIGDDAHTRLLLQCSPRYTNSAWHPVIHGIEFDAQIRDQDDADARLEKLEALLGKAGPPASETVALFAALLSIPAKRHPLPELTPPQQKERTLAALVDHVAALSGKAPVLLVLEDAHWVDPTSLELMERMLERIRELPVLMLITYRPEFTAPWVGEDHVTLLALNRLGRRARARMAEQLTTTLAPDLVAQIAARSDGIPLFIEELARSACEATAGPRIIPATLHDALEARFDRSPAVREIAQVGAAIGRDFGYPLLAQVVGLASVDLDAALGELVGSGILFTRGTPPDASYTFKHALIQDTAYGTLLRSKRAALHGRIAEALSGTLTAGGDAVPEVVAHHFTEAGDAERAIPLWQAAGGAALQRSAYVEATAHLKRALDLLRALPDAEAWAERELELLVTLGPALIGAKGMAAAELGAVHERASDLADAVGDWEKAFRARWGAWQFIIQSPPLERAERAAAGLAAMAETTEDPGHWLQAHHAQWTTAFFVGDFVEAQRHISESRLLYDVDRHSCHVHVYGGHDPGVCACSFESCVSWLQGYPEHGRRAIERGRALADRVDHDTSSAIMLYWIGLYHLLCGAYVDAAAAGRRSLAFAEANAPPMVAACGLLGGLAQAASEPGRPADPALLTLSQQPSLAGLQFALPLLRSMLARIQADAGRTEEALTLIQEALDSIAPYESFWCAAEVHRQQGEVLRTVTGDLAEAERCFDLARTLAQAHGAKSWELRAVTSLARLRRDQDRADEGRAVLAPLYQGFTEGFDTADLVEARALLD